MKNSPMTTILLTVLAFSAIFSLITCYLFVSRSRELRELQVTTQNIEVKKRTAMALANDAVEYSKKNPAIDPILEQVGLKPKPGAASAPKPATK
jgi:hypothetical protein